MFKNHPKGLVVLALTNMGERFGYYTMLAILTLYMQAKFGFTSSTTSIIYGVFLAVVYFFPVFGGVLADKVLGYGKTILMGIIIMFFGKVFMSDRKSTRLNSSHVRISYAVFCLKKKKKKKYNKCIE